MTGLGAIYDQSTEIGGISGRFNSVGAYGHKVVGNSWRPPWPFQARRMTTPER